MNIALNFLEKEKYTDFVLVDMGCGYGRVGKYFLSKLPIFFYGLEINEKIVKSISSDGKFRQNSKILQLDLRDKSKREKIFFEIKNFNKKIVIFFSDPFDIDTIVDILETFKSDQHIIIGVNVNNLEKLLTNYKIKYIKNFENKLRHVVLLKKNEQ